MGRPDLGMPDESKELAWILPQAQAPFLALRMVQWPRANLLEPLLIMVFQTIGRSRVDRFLPQAPAELASLTDPFLHSVGKALGSALGVIALRQRLEQRVPFLGGAPEMTPAGLWVGSPERVVDARPVGVEEAPQFCPHDGFGPCGGTRPVDVKKRPVFVPRVPEVLIDPSDAPTRFIPVQVIAGLDFLAQVLVEFLGFPGGGTVEIQRGGRNQAPVEELGEPPLHFAIGPAEALTQINGRGFGDGADR